MCARSRRWTIGRSRDATVARRTQKVNWNACDGRCNGNGRSDKRTIVDIRLKSGVSLKCRCRRHKLHFYYLIESRFNSNLNFHCTKSEGNASANRMLRYALRPQLPRSIHRRWDCLAIFAQMRWRWINIEWVCAVCLCVSGAASSRARVRARKSFKLNKNANRRRINNLYV